LAVAIRDSKGVVICGMDSRYSGVALELDAEGGVCCQFSFDTLLMPGVYNIALRVLDFPFGDADLLIEKQLNAVTFEVVDDGVIPVGSSGFVVLNGVCAQV